MSKTLKYGKCGVCDDPLEDTVAASDNLCWVCRRLRNSVLLELAQD